MPAESGRSHQSGWASALVAVALASVDGLRAPSAGTGQERGGQPAHDPSPGARTEAERTHVLEAQWTEVEVKGRKEGDAVVSAIKLVQPKIRILHAAPPPEDAAAAPEEEGAAGASRARPSI